MTYKPLTFESTGAASTAWEIWTVMPAAVLLGLFVWSKIASDRPTLQETWLKLEAIVIVTATWFIIGLILAVVAGAHPLGRALVMALCLSVGLGMPGGIFLLEVGTRPVRLDPQPTRFAHSGSAKQSVFVRAVDGPAAGVQFIFDVSEWRRTSDRDPNRFAHGNVYRGRHNLWFATLD